MIELTQWSLLGELTALREGTDDNSHFAGEQKFTFNEEKVSKYDADHEHVWEVRRETNRRRKLTVRGDETSLNFLMS